jgi:hypothetical protein
MAWPVALVAELAARRCILFLGAGASASSLAADGTSRPPLWTKFLCALKAACPPGSDLSAVDDLIAKEKLLDAAEILIAKIPAADFTRVVREQFVQPRFSNSAIHLSVLNLDPKIVVTTNYDDIYDGFCRTGLAHDGYNVCKYYEDHLVNDLRSPVRLIVKAHGCVSDPSRIVLTRSQYFRERQKHGVFYSVLDALFLTNTVLFVGYGLSDPDIQLVLENASIAARSAHPHYAFVEDKIQADVEAAAKVSYNIHFIKYPAGHHEEAERMMRELADEVMQFRIANPA